jgi:hypothetical protein
MLIRGKMTKNGEGYGDGYGDGEEDIVCKSN